MSLCSWCFWLLFGGIITNFSLFCELISSRYYIPQILTAFFALLSVAFGFHHHPTHE